MKFSNINKFLLLLLTITSLSSCDFIGGVFKTGMGVGVLLVVMVLIVIVAVVSRIGKK